MFCCFNSLSYDPYEHNSQLFVKTPTKSQYLYLLEAVDDENVSNINNSHLKIGWRLEWFKADEFPIR